MKTRKLLLLAILTIAFALASCKQVSGGDYYSNGNCQIQRLNFYSSEKVTLFIGGSSGNPDAYYIQNGNTVTVTLYGSYVYKFHFDAAGCLIQDDYPACKYCEQ